MRIAYDAIAPLWYTRNNNIEVTLTAQSCIAVCVKLRDLLNSNILKKAHNSCTNDLMMIKGNDLLLKCILALCRIHIEDLALA